MIRRLITIALIATFLTAPAWAQRPRAQGQRQQQQLKRLLKQKKAGPARKAKQNAKRADAQQVRKFQRALDLTDAQTPALRGLLATRDQELARLKAAGKGQRKQDPQAIQERFLTGFRALLAPEQAQILDNRKNGRKARPR